MNPAHNAKEFVRWVMDKYPSTREDDQRLILACWVEQGLRLSEAQKAFIIHQGMKAETIRRTRQELKQAGYYPKRVDELALFTSYGEQHDNPETGSTAKQSRDETYPG